MQKPALILVMLNSRIKYQASSVNHKIAAYMFLYIEFPNMMQYHYINVFVMMPRSTMPSGHSINISTDISGCRNATSASHSSRTYNYYS